MRRVHLRGHPKILKRLLVNVGECNLGPFFLHVIGVGTPWSLQGRTAALFRPQLRRLRDCGAFQDISGRSSCRLCRARPLRGATRAHPHEGGDFRLRLPGHPAGEVRE